MEIINYGDEDHFGDMGDVSPEDENDYKNFKPKYQTYEERKEAQKGYRRKWYLANRERIRLNRDLKRERDNRAKRVHKGYFKVFSDKSVYYGYSKDIHARCRDIIKTIPSNKKGHLYNRFPKDQTYKYQILEFSDVNDPQRFNEIMDYETEQYPELDPI